MPVRSALRSLFLHTEDYDGHRTAIRAAGLPDMKVIPASTIAKLGRIPRSTEGHAINAIDAVQRHGGDEWGYSKAIVVFVSHRWKRPLWCESLGRRSAL